jgi:hypothetical protein
MRSKPSRADCACRAPCSMTTQKPSAHPCGASASRVTWPDNSAGCDHLYLGSPPATASLDVRAVPSPHRTRPPIEEPIATSKRCLKHEKHGRTRAPAKQPTTKKLAATTQLGERTGAVLVTPLETGSSRAPVLPQLLAGNLQRVHNRQMFGKPKNNTPPAQTSRSNDHESCGAKGTRTPDPLTASEVRYQLRHSPGAK